MSPSNDTILNPAAILVKHLFGKASGVFASEHNGAAVDRPETADKGRSRN